MVQEGYAGRVVRVHPRFIRSNGRGAKGTVG